MRNNRGQNGFTLIELLVVIGIIALALAIVLPSIMSVFNSGAQAQARNMLSATLGSARSLAIEKMTRTLVHVQRAPDDTCWVMVFQADTLDNNKFKQVPGLPPSQLPGGLAAGGLDKHLLIYQWQRYYGFDGSKLDAQAKLDDLTCFNVVFGSDGAMVTDGLPVNIDTTASVFSASSPGRIWDCSNVDITEAGVNSMVIFDYVTLKLKATGTDRAAVLDSSPLLVVNQQTGYLLPVK